MGLWIQETFVNETEGYQFGESEVYETCADSRGEPFRDLQQEYGRCVSKMFIDTADGVKTVGWVFQKVMGYENDPTKKYVRTVWVSLHKGPPTRIVNYDYTDAEI